MKNHPKVVLVFLGGPGRNRTTDTRTFNSDRPSSFLLFSKSNSVDEKFCACAVIFFNAVRKYLDSISTIPLRLFAKIFYYAETAKDRAILIQTTTFSSVPYIVIQRTSVDLYELCTLMRSESVVAFVFALPHAAVAVFHAPLVVAFLCSQHFALTS